MTEPIWNQFLTARDKQVFDKAYPITSTTVHPLW